MASSTPGFVGFEHVDSVDVSRLKTAAVATAFTSIATAVMGVRNKSNAGTIDDALKHLQDAINQAAILHV